MRAKFTCIHHDEHVDRTGATHSEYVELSVVVGTEGDNEEFWNATPNGHIRMSITNPDAFGFFEQGSEYYLDFTEA